MVLGLGGLFNSRSTQKTEVDVDPRYQQFLDQNLDIARDAFDGFRAFGTAEDRIAGFADDELAAFEQFRGISDPNSLAAQVGRTNLERFASAPTLDDLRPYTDPFLDDVLDRSSQRVFDAYDQQLTRLRSQAADQGAFGGSRFAVAESNMIENLGQQIGDMSYRARSDAFNQGMDRFFDSARQGIGAAGTVMGQDAQRAGLLQGVGQSIRGLDQAGRDFDFSEFMRDENTQRQDAINLANIAQAYPRDIFTRTTTQETSPSIFNTVAGLAGAVAGIPGVGGAIGGLFGGGGSGGGVNPFAGGVASSPTFQTMGVPAASPDPFGFRAAATVPGFKEGGHIKKMATGGPTTGFERFERFGRELRPVVDNVASFFGFEDIFNEPKQAPKPPPMSTEEVERRSAMGFAIPEASPVTFPDAPSIKPSRPQQTANPFAPPNPSRKPSGASETPAVTPSTALQLFAPSEAPRRPSADSAGGEDRNWRQRWLDNPFTQLGLTLLAGENNPLGRSAGMLLEQRTGELAEQRQDAALEEEREFRQQQANAELRQKAAEMMLEQQQAEEEARREAEESALDRANRLEIARIRAAGAKDPKDNPALEATADQLEFLRKQQSSIERMLQGFINPNDPRRVELEAERGKLQSQITALSRNIEAMTGADFNLDEETVEPIGDDPLGLR